MVRVFFFWSSFYGKKLMLLMFLNTLVPANGPAISPIGSPAASPISPSVSGKMKSIMLTIVGCFDYFNFVCKTICKSRA